jgi:hypothetical protein
MVCWWLSFKFKLADDVEKILVRKWYWGPFILYMKHWSPSFDPISKTSFRKSIWVSLIYLPMNLWNNMLMKNIVERLGNFMDYDLEFQPKFNRK